MAKVLVIYASDEGHTKALAQAIAQGASATEHAVVDLKTVGSVLRKDMVWADAVIIGSPVHMSAMHWSIKRFVDVICGPLWNDDRMVGKVGAAFVTGGGAGGAGGGSDLAILGILANFAALGMFIVPLPKTTLGFQEGALAWGAYARTEDDAGRVRPISESCLGVARQHGENVARTAQVLRDNTIFVRRAVKNEGGEVQHPT